MKRIKVVGKHIPDCGAVRHAKQGDWDTCWGPLAFGRYGQPIVRTHRRYGRHGRVFHTWLRFVCNDTDCKAELHVEAHSVALWADRSLIEARAMMDYHETYRGIGFHRTHKGYWIFDHVPPIGERWSDYTDQSWPAHDKPGTPPESGARLMRDGVDRWHEAHRKGGE